MLNLKLKLPLLALSISTALIAPQIASAAPYKILALGDSITNGIHNGGNALAYRDDLHLLLKANGYSYEYVGKCPTYSATDETGDCAQDSLYSPGVIDAPATSGTVFLHEGRAGKHANYFNENGRLNDLLTNWYHPEAIFLHIGTNDIYQQENDINKNDTVVEEITYTTTLADIETMVNTIKAMPYEPKIYLAKILPIGRVSKNGIDSTYTGAGGDAAKRLNQLIEAKYGSDPKVTIVDQNTNFTSAHMSSDMVHPKGVGEAVMAQRWFAKFKLDFVKNGADKTKSTLSADKSTVTANDDDFATVTFQAIDIDGENLTTGGDTVEIYNTATTITVSPTVDNGDGTYTATVKRNKATGVANIRAKLNGADITAIAPITFIPAQTIVFNPPLTMGFAEEKVLSDVTSLKFGTTTPTTLKVTVAVDSSSSTTCKIDADNKLTAMAQGSCKLIASQEGGTASNITYGAATPVEKTIVIGKGTQIITFDASTPSTGFVGGSFTPKATSTSGLAVAFTTAPKAVCSIASNKVTFKSAGTCKVIASQAGDANYSTASVVTNITVSDDKITLPSIPDKTVGDPDFSPTVTSSSGAAVTLTASPANVCTVSGSKVSIGKSAGTCTLTATTANSSATTTFNVKKNASQLAIDTVAKVINGSGSITVAQLEPIKGLKNLKNGTNYTKALKAGTYADKNNPTVAELQTVIDKVNKDNNKSGGSSSPLWLLMLSFVALIRRKSTKEASSNS